jgi:hypothetical protein
LRLVSLWPPTAKSDKLFLKKNRLALLPHEISGGGLSVQKEDTTAKDGRLENTQVSYIMAKKTYWVIMPRNPDEAIRLAQKIMAKHEKDGEASRLRDLDLQTARRKLKTADEENTQSKEFHQKGEACTGNRDIALGTNNPLQPGTVMHFNSSARDVLLGDFKGNERALAEWGFEVVAATRPTGESAEDGDQPGGSSPRQRKDSRQSTSDAERQEGVRRR